ncbi:MAG: hypothetical protein R3C26_24790 [Calditrichia bacterium]
MRNNSKPGRRTLRIVVEISAFAAKNRSGETFWETNSFDLRHPLLLTIGQRALRNQKLHLSPN